MNRGSSLAFGGRTRKGLTLLWIALFVFSLLLQSVVLAAPTPALAASGLLADTVQGFELFGDAVVDVLTAAERRQPDDLCAEPQRDVDRVPVHGRYRPGR